MISGRPSAYILYLSNHHHDLQTQQFTISDKSMPCQLRQRCLTRVFTLVVSQLWLRTDQLYKHMRSFSRKAVKTPCGWIGLLSSISSCDIQEIRSTRHEFQHSWQAGVRSYICGSTRRSCWPGDEPHLVPCSTSSTRLSIRNWMYCSKHQVRAVIDGASLGSGKLHSEIAMSHNAVCACG